MNGRFWEHCGAPKAEPSRNVCEHVKGQNTAGPGASAAFSSMARKSHQREIKHIRCVPNSYST